MDDKEEIIEFKDLVLEFLKQELVNHSKQLTLINQVLIDKILNVKIVK